MYSALVNSGIVLIFPYWYWGRIIAYAIPKASNRGGIIITAEEVKEYW